MCDGVTRPQERLGGLRAGQSPRLHPGGGWPQLSPLGSPGDWLALLGSYGSLISAGLHPAVFCPRQSSLVLSSLDTVAVWHRVMGVRGVLGLGCPAEAQSGLTPKLIMYLAVGRDP